MVEGLAEQVRGEPEDPATQDRGQRVLRDVTAEQVGRPRSQGRGSNCERVVRDERTRERCQGGKEQRGPRDRGRPGEVKAHRGVDAIGQKGRLVAGQHLDPMHQRPREEALVGTKAADGGVVRCSDHEAADQHERGDAVTEQHEERLETSHTAECTRQRRRAGWLPTRPSGRTLVIRKVRCGGVPLPQRWLDDSLSVQGHALTCADLHLPYSCYSRTDHLPSAVAGR